MLRQTPTKNTRARIDNNMLSNASCAIINVGDILSLFDNLEDAPHSLVLDLVQPLFSSDSFIRILGSIDDSWTIYLEHLTDSGYALDVDAKKIWIDNSGLLPDALAQSVYFRQCIRHNLLRAVREIWHCENFQDDYDTYVPESLIKCERVRSADVECFALLCIYEMHLCEEQSRLWQHLLSSDVGDMAIAFSRFLERGPFTHNKLDLALQQAFKQWYSDHARVDSCDHRTLEEIDHIMMWDKADMASRHQTIKPSKLCEMTARPNDKGSYLGDLNIRLMRHPAYSVMDDGINQIHLAHIIRDLESVAKGDVYFRSAELAEKIFPEVLPLEKEGEDILIR